MRIKRVSELGFVRLKDKRIMKHEDLTHKIIGSAMKVHSNLGNGFQEVIYQRALAIEMTKLGLGFQREMEMTIFYDGVDIGTRRVDFFVEENIMVEIKALIKLEEVHLAQAMNYCQAYNLPIGLLINFGAKSLEFKRVYNVNHSENKEYKKSELGLNRLKDDRITNEEILKSANPNADVYWTGNYIFENEWQSFRTKKKPILEYTIIAHEYKKARKYKVMVIVVDILGIDTSKIIEVNIQ